MSTPELPPHAPDVLGDVLPTPPAGRRRTGLLAAAAVGALAVAGVGTAAAFALSGGGAQPEDVLPSGALAFAKIDLDPSAGQKLNAYRLAQSFPEASRGLASADTLRDDVLRRLLEDQDVDYDREIAPWLGDRAGVAVLPSGDQEPDVVVALAHTDQDRARSALEGLAGEDPVAFSFVDGYVLLSDEQSVVDRAAGADEHLVDDASFSEAVDALDGEQVALAWTDLERFWDAVPQEAREGAFDLDVEPTGQVVVGLRVESDAVEVVGRTVGVSTGAQGGDVLTAAEGSGLVRDLPAEAVVALATTGLDTTVTNAYEQFLGAVGELASEVEAQAADVGIELPGGLAAVVGRETAAAAWGDLDSPEVLLRTRNDDPEQALAVLARALTAGGQQGELEQYVQRRDDGLAIGTPGALAAGGGLGDREEFRDAVPDAAQAGLVAWVSVQDALTAAQVEPSEQTDPLEAVGLSVTGGDTGEFRLRLTFR